ncbi:alpha/beta hydrolase [Corallococcus exiguus]|uniref:esterase/lipase family protein n=1 Tax=Corallococcus TaxID=83461 RepID=UPI000EA2E5D8|nr:MULTISPECIES: alpha/beta hydrolase [Corallococcus]NNC14201.1 alpha/beta hydrolase [Corallococcus exiguus]NRD55695.1 alpha/beta hydrolase [Corallococcus exiguus]NRD64570.1 alpha/beta hydrolase [Corallococcus exiguus]RKH29575.1 alpha/beta hydrolase [Corallococcus sp. CA041A]RKI19632.1 alpha/beta hydrolase [Corallococcus sp. AB030]
MTHRHRVYLVPGFFGFTQMGDKETERIAYFQNVPRLLEQRFQERGIDARVHAIASAPTSGLEARARDVFREMARTANEDDAQLHLVGHSTGGLDARSVVSPRMAREAPDFVKRVRSVVTIATPHQGTPLASFSNQGGVGKTLLRYLWLFTFLTLHRKAMPLRTAALQACYWLVLRSEEAKLPPNLFNQIARLTADLSEGEREELIQFFSQVGENQVLIQDLMPISMRAFNANTADREGVRYGCVVTGAPPPRWSLPLLLTPDALLHGLFAFLYAKSAPQSRELQIPERTPAQTQALQDVLGRRFESKSDGIVPSRSQVWGQVLHVATADHLDVMGHFDQPPEHISWLKSGSHFQEPQFQAMWDRVIDFTVGGAATVHPGKEEERRASSDG